MNKFPIITLSLYQGKFITVVHCQRTIFGKLKRNCFLNHILFVPHAVLDKVGNELTDPQNIILAYRNEMFHWLQKRLIRANLKNYESAMNQLCRHRLHKARTTHSPDFSLSEVRNAISELKEGRCIDPTGFVRNIYKSRYWTCAVYRDDAKYDKEKVASSI